MPYFIHPLEALDTMWLQLRLYLLVGVMFAILYGILVGIGYFLGITGFSFYLLIIGVAAGFVLLQYAIGPKISPAHEDDNPRVHFYPLPGHLHPHVGHGDDLLCLRFDGQGYEDMLGGTRPDGTSQELDEGGAGARYAVVHDLVAGPELQTVDVRLEGPEDAGDALENLVLLHGRRVGDSSLYSLALSPTVKGGIAA